MTGSTGDFLKLAAIAHNSDNFATQLSIYRNDGLEVDRKHFSRYGEYILLHQGIAFLTTLDSVE